MVLYCSRKNILRRAILRQFKITGVIFKCLKMYKSSGSRRPFSGGNRNGAGRGHSFNKFRSGRGRRSGNNSSRGSVINNERYINKAESVEFSEYKPVNRFIDFNLDERLLENIVRKGYTAPMAIQDQAIGPIMAGKDLLGIANTGMGKTAAFLIPLINKMVNDQKQKVLVITPTRELAEQIETEFINLARGLRLNSVLVIGGASINKQSWLLRKQWNLVVGTPGRLKDLLKRNILNLISVNNLVLDEVDRMFDMGFAQDVSALLEALAPQRQSLFFSATLAKREEELVMRNSNNPVKISVRIRDTAASVDQNIVKVNGDKPKIEVLHDILITEDVKKTLIFARTKYGVEKLSVELQRRGFKADAIHGNKSQYQRQRVLSRFKEDRISILVATDVAARGLDIPNVTHVINYEVPENYEDYIHRIGRTGRANNIGKALTFVN